MDSGAGDAVLSDVSLAMAEAQNAITDLIRCGDDVGDVLREFQRIAAVMASMVADEKKLASQNIETRTDIETTHAALVESKGVVVDFQAIRNTVMDEVRRADADLTDCQARIAEYEARKEAIVKSSNALSATLERGPGWTPEQREKQSALQNTKSELMVRLESGRTTAMNLKRDVDNLEEFRTRGEESKTETLNEMATVREETKAVLTKAQKLTQSQGKQTAELKELQGELEATQKTLAEKEQSVQNGSVTIAKYEHLIKGKKADLERVAQEYNVLHGKTASITDELDSQMSVNEDLAQDLLKIKSRTEEYAKEAGILRSEASRSVALHDLAARKLQECNDAITEVDDEVAELNRRTVAARAEADALHKSNDMLERSHHSLEKERDILRAALEKLSDSTVQIDTIMATQASSQKMTETELTVVRKQVKEYRDAIDDLREDLIDLEEKLDEKNRHVARTAEQLSLQGVQEVALKRKIIDLNGKLKQQQSVYEGARDERNSYSKTLLDVEAEITKISHDFKSITKLIENFKEEINVKDHELVKEHFDHHKTEKEKEGIRAEAVKLKRQIKSCDEIMDAQAVEKGKLVAVMTRASEEKSRQSKELAGVLGERDALRSQVVQRDSELTVQYEKLKIQRSSLEKGAATFSHEKQTEAELTATIQKMRHELYRTKLQVSNTETLRKEIMNLEKDLAAERLKTVTLETEAERPMNIHRWRQLESSNPELFAKITRAQNLHKRLIQTAEEIAQREVLTAQKEKLFKELKAVLDRQPSHEVEEQLLGYRDLLKQKKQQLRAMEAELEAVKAAVKDSRFDIEKYNEGLEKLQRMYVSRVVKGATGES